MNKNLRAFLWLLAIGINQFVMAWSMTSQGSDSYGIGEGIAILFFTVVLSLVFVIIIFNPSEEHRILRAFIWLVISLLFLFSLAIIGGRLGSRHAESNRKKINTSRQDPNQYNRMLQGI